MSNYKKYSNEDRKFMSSLSSAALEKTKLNSRLILWTIITALAWLIFWASKAEIDELTRGMGKVIPSHKVQIVQNLEGGIVEKMYIEEGDEVKKGDPLVKLSDINFASTFKESNMRYKELKAKIIRLNAESFLKPFAANKEDKNKLRTFIRYEKNLYDSNKEQLEKSIEILQQQLKQRRNELSEMRAKMTQLRESYRLIAKEIKITKPLSDKGVVSEVDFLKLQRQANDMSGELKRTEISISRISSTIEEAKKKIEGAKLEFQNKAKKELNEVIAEMNRLQESKGALEDRVKRTLVTSPVDGTVKQVMINTIGGVIKPGMDILEVVPSDDKLLIEAKIKPQDIAFLYPGQKAIVKFTAYDFSIYGGLDGKLEHISADTIVDEEGNSFYLVRIKTDKNFLKGKEGKLLYIKVGMIANVDIITGKKTVLDYLMKPILKAQQSALRER